MTKFLLQIVSIKSVFFIESTKHHKTQILLVHVHLNTIYVKNVPCAFCKPLNDNYQSLLLYIPFNKKVVLRAVFLAEWFM